MNSIDLFLIQYGLIALFLVLFAKTAGAPIPIPTDLIILAAAARIATGGYVLWQVFLVILLALVLGALVQFLLARGPGRGLLYRFGRYLGLTPARLNAASQRVKQGGIVGLSIAILIPGVRGVAVAACGLADIPVIKFLAGTVIGSTLFLSLHLLLGYLGGTFFAAIGRILPMTGVVPIVLLLLVVVYILWMIAYQRNKAAHQEPGAASLELWHEGICPACLALYSVQRLNASGIEGKM
jgi:membrane protein DedA with SNARE-associated domain